MAQESGSRDVWEDALASAYAALGWPAGRQCHIVYSEQYNIHFYGLERLHPFDACKFRKIMRALQASGLVNKNVVAEAREVSEASLREVHTAAYLDELHSSPAKVAEVVELAPLRLLPNRVLQTMLMQKMRVHVGGTMLAVALALRHGWAVNLGGGMHHAFYAGGSGWCPYSDITLAIRALRAATGGSVCRVMVIDTDAHQGNGYARDKLHFNDRDVFIVDVYNAMVFPQDAEARRGIDVEVQLQSDCEDAVYLEKLGAALDAAFSKFEPHLVIHNAGSDILAGDPLGRLNVSADTLAKRDALVHQRCRCLNVPVCMLLSGGYARQSAAAVIASLKAIIESETLASIDRPVAKPV